MKDFFNYLCRTRLGEKLCGQWDKRPTQIVGILFLLTATLCGLLGYINQYFAVYLTILGKHVDVYQDNPFIGDFYANIATELVSIAITVLIIDFLNERRIRGQLKSQLIRELGSKSQDFSVRAARELRYHGWLKDGSLHGSDLGWARLETVDLSYASMNKVNLIEAKLMSSNLEGACLTMAELENADFGDANLQGADLTNAYLRGANIKANLISAKLNGADLAESNFSTARMWDAELKGANLSRANFSQADLRNAVLVNSILIGTNLCQATLNNADLSDTDLREANLENAILIGATLLRSDLREANLEGADLSYADLTGARVSTGQIQQASISNTIMPDGTPCGEASN